MFNRITDPLVIFSNVLIVYNDQKLNVYHF